MDYSKYLIIFQGIRDGKQMNYYDTYKMGGEDPLQKDVIDWTSDDWGYLGNLPTHEKRTSRDGFYSPLKQSHHVRLLVVFGNAMIEGYASHIALKTGIANELEKSPEKVTVIELVEKFRYPPKFLTVGSLDQLEIVLKGIMALRNIIAHGLHFESAKNYAGKKESIVLAGLVPNPVNLTETHFKIILETFNNVVNILGSGSILYNRDQR